MPLYDYRCPDCGAVDEAQRRIAEREAPMPCQKCGGAMVPAVLTAPMIDRMFIGSTKCPGYQCVVTDRYISSTRERREMIAETGAMPKE